MDVGQCSKPGSDVKGYYGFNETSVECYQNGLVALEFAKEKETLLALWVDFFSICFEVEFVVDYCPKLSICVNPLYQQVVRLGKVEGALRNSIISYFVLVMLRSRQFCLQQSEKVANSDCNWTYALVESIMTVSSEYWMYVMSGFMLLQLLV